ncbi:hypothetical protein BamIOP4010DRAFT_2822 [Burkholderia ambifaria IOP40-10]|jgi:hypothetical protein|uniref:Uncharacterized protein n=1 Tax=Burkholderia ambifaria IOP40-10 TaxID=396596 RepID=B1FFL2_9BURK|nr:hypothetical protein [Burkholderia ambifaria]EDT03663.1 hypothetical protein BamIOP4010DRAFT_2822 [Burkholderia ambifaria IOP40-10]
MKILLFSIVVASTFLGVVCAQQLSRNDPDLSKAAHLLGELCGYSLDNSILEKVKSSSVSFENNVFRAEFLLELKPVDRYLKASLYFGCFLPGKDSMGSKIGVPLTARGEIANEDSGGRYARNVVWERKYTGLNWIGTMAYVDSIFGDGSSRKIPAYFMTCPKVADLPCFSLEFERNDLVGREVDRIQDLIHGIYIVDHSKK